MIDETNGAVPLAFATESRLRQWSARAVALDFITNELIERKSLNPQAFMRGLREKGLRIDTHALYNLRRDAWERVEGPGSFPPSTRPGAKPYKSARGYLTPLEAAMVAQSVSAGRVGELRGYFGSIQVKEMGRPGRGSFLLDAWARLHQETEVQDLDRLADPPQVDPERSAVEGCSGRSRLQRLRESGKIAEPDPYAYVEIRIDSRCGSDTVAAVIAMALDLGGVQDLDLRASLSQDEGGNIHLKLNP